MRYFYKILLVLLFSLMNLHVGAAETNESIKVDSDHVLRWNKFVDKLHALHKNQLESYTFSTSEKTGGYRDNPKFYREVSYHDQNTGKVLSRIQWEQQNPSNIHSIEVYVYNKAGKLARDYGASYLPNYRNAPVQTLVNLHSYSGGLHSFRQFDINGDRIYEICEGTFKGKEVQIRLFEDDLAGASEDSDRTMASPVYKACFKGVQQTLGKYSNPQ